MTAGLQTKEEKGCPEHFQGFSNPWKLWAFSKKSPRDQLTLTCLPEYTGNQETSYKNIQNTKVQSQKSKNVKTNELTESGNSMV